MTISYQEFHAAMTEAGAKAELTERIATKLELSPREHNRIQKKVLDKVTPPMITIGCNQTAVKDSRGKGIPEKSERTKKSLQEIMAKRPETAAKKVGCTREQLIGKLNAKVVEGKRKRLELSEQDLFRKNVASVAAKMSPTATYLDPNGLTPKPYVKGDAQAAKTLKNMNKPSTENPTNKFTPALDGSELPKVSMSNLASKKLGQASGTKDGKAQMKGAPQWDANLASPKKPIQNAGGNPYSGAI